MEGRTTFERDRTVPWVRRFKRRAEGMTPVLDSGAQALPIGRRSRLSGANRVATVYCRLDSSKPLCVQLGALSLCE